jgi:LPXTG-motif cell wall-anchored protein
MNMKRFKKFAAMVLALAMCFALAISASATDYTITVSGAIDGRTYNAYKIFDGTGTGDNVAYTIGTDSEWFNTVAGLTATPTAYATTYTANGLTLTQSAADANKYVVTKTENFNAATFAEVLDAAKTGKAIAASATAAKAENSDTVSAVITVSSEGYYYVDSTLGSLCALTTTSTNVTINEKNSIPSITKTVEEDHTGTYGASATADRTDTLNYRLVVNTGTNSNGVNGANGVDADYEITDVLPTGITANEDSVHVTVPDGWVKGADYTVSLSGQTLTITLKAAKVAALGQKADIYILYTATMSETVATNTALTNTVTLSYNGQTSTSSATVQTFKLGDENNATLKKTDGEGNVLPGVKFILSKDVTTTETTGEGEDAVTTTTTTTWYAQVDDNDYLTGWTTEKSQAIEIVSKANGAIVVKGLDADTYTLTETETLAGYNILQDTITAVIAEDGSVTYKLTSSTGSGANTLNIVNESGATLPSTGGMGTTIFYVVGGILVLGAGIVLVTKKRMANR